MARLAGPGLLLTLSACAATQQDCFLIAPDPLATQQCRADSGDKAAQLQLGIRYEQGIGVKRDLSRAAALYRAAATSESGMTFVYSPPVGEAPGTVLPVRTGPATPGLPEAQYRLGLLYLEGRGVRFDYRRGMKLIDQAAAAGFEPAITKQELLKNGPVA